MSKKISKKKSGVVWKSSKACFCRPSLCQDLVRK